jgi:hypothetical protein
MVFSCHDRTETKTSRGILNAWGLVVTQVSPEDIEQPFAMHRHQQPFAFNHHQPLAFPSGSVSGAQLHWAVIEKEAFAIMEAIDRFRIFTDHCNLMYVFDPGTPSAHFRQKTADKLPRWVSRLYEYHFVIKHISGEDNVGADMLSRWVPSESKSPNLSLMNSLDLSDGLYKTIDGKIWVPYRNALRQRMCAIAHCGIAGHRRVEATTTAILSKFYWPDLQNDVMDFCKKCLHCIASLDGEVPRARVERITQRKEIQWFTSYSSKTAMLLRLLREFLSSQMI